LPLAEDSKSNGEVRFCRKDAEADKYVGLEVTEGDVRGDEDGEQCIGEIRLHGVDVESRILSWEVDRFKVGVPMTSRKLGCDVNVPIVLCDISRGTGEESRSISASSCGQTDSKEDNRSRRTDKDDILLALFGGVGSSGKNLAGRGVSCP